jgi:dihydrodipicolinate synthase/N-acetylneuraminate lyase
MWAKLEGIVPPLVTPLVAQDRIDTDGTRKVIEHVIAGGVAGIFILGSTGEAPSLSYALRREFIRLCCEIVNGRVPVLVGGSDTAIVETIQLAKFAKQSGASAVVVTSPYYFACTQDDLVRYIRSLLDQIDGMPLMLYNMPGLTNVWFDIATVKELSQHPGIVGIKDSSGDLNYFEKLCQLHQERPDWSIFMGPEHLIAQAMKLGANGGVPGGANVEPELFVSLFKAKGEEVTDIQKRVDQLQEIYTVGPWFVVTKCACSVRSLCGDFVALPFTQLTDAQRAKVKDVLDGLRINRDQH